MTSTPPTSELPWIDLGPGSRVVADAHLDAADEAACEPFVRWTRELEGAPALAVLGDLFDVWVGPAQARMPGAAAVLDALAELAGAGTRVVIVPGNRDFLLDRSFEQRARARVAPEGFRARIGDERSGRVAVCVHGDTLCTLDRDYQRLRRVLRSAPVQWIAPRLPLWTGTALARRLRRASVRAIAAKPSQEKSVQPSAAAALARAQGASLVVCGHAHAYRDVVLEGGVRWIVLDAFGGERSVVTVARDGSLAIGAPATTLGLEARSAFGDAARASSEGRRTNPSGLESRGPEPGDRSP